MYNIKNYIIINWLIDNISFVLLIRSEWKIIIINWFIDISRKYSEEINDAQHDLCIFFFFFFFFFDTQHLSTNEKVIIKEQEIVSGIYTFHIFGNSLFDSSLNEQENNFKFYWKTWFWI